MWPDEGWKIARPCGGKHISKSKCTKHLNFGALLELRCRKKCMPLWREAKFEVKRVKRRSRTTFGSWDVEKVHAVVARSTCPSQNVQKHPHVRTVFWRSDVVLRGRRNGLSTLSKISKSWGFCNTFNYNHHYTPLRYTTLHYKYKYSYHYN